MRRRVQPSTLNPQPNGEDDNTLALRAYTSEQPVPLVFNPKSSWLRRYYEYPLSGQMNTALREYRAGGRLISSLCSGVLWKLKELHYEFGTPTDCVYFGSELDFTDEDGEQLFFKNFRSTSMSYDVACEFAGPDGFVYEVALESSTICADVSEFSEFQIEAEVLIATGQHVWVHQYSPYFPEGEDDPDFHCDPCCYYTDSDDTNY